MGKYQLGEDRTVNYTTSQNFIPQPAKNRRQGIIGATLHTATFVVELIA